MLVRFRCGEKGYLLQVSDLSQQLSSETTTISMAENLPLGTAVVVVSWMGTERRAPMRHATRMLVVSFHNVKGTSPCSQVSPLTLSKTLAKSLTDYSEPNTYSIDLTSSWTNETVKLEKILKNGPPIVNQEALWQDAGGKAFYAYDGATSNAFDVQNPPSSNTLYQFLPDGAGFGAWSVVPAPANTNFSQLSRAFGAAYTSGNGLGFALGGLQNSQTIAGYPFDAVAQAGLVIYDTSSEQWNNVSALGYSSDGTSTGAAAQFVPNFGPSGLLFVLEGQVNGGRTYVSTASVNIFDPVSRQWKTQEVTGTPPPSSVQSCVVGAQGDNATYEVSSDRCNHLNS